MPNGKEKKTAQPVEQPAEEPITQEPVAAEQPTKEQLMAEMQAAMTANDWKLVSQVSRKIDTITKAAEKAEVDAKRAELDAMSETVKTVLIGAITPLVDSGQLDKADGIWLSYDFGDKAPTVRLMKTTTRTPKAGGGGTGKRFDISTEDMLAKHGEEDYKDGMNFKTAYESNTDKNWRYAIRQKLLKLEGII